LRVSNIAIQRLVLGRWLVLVCVCVVFGGCVESAVASGGGWELHLSSQPTFVTAARGGNIVLLATDRSAAGTGAGVPVQVTISLPSGLSANDATIESRPDGAGRVPCEVLSGGGLVECLFSEGVAGSNSEGLVVDVSVSTSVSAGSELVKASVAAGESPAASVSGVVAVSDATPGFGASFGVVSAGYDGLPDLRAGDHPNVFTTYLEFNNEQTTAGHEADLPVEPIGLLQVDLPLGLVADPQSAPTCATDTITTHPENCPPGSMIGTIAFASSKVGGYQFSGEEDSPIYNRTPEGGYAAEFTFTFLGDTGTIFGTLAHTKAGYVLRGSVTGIPDYAEFKGALLTFFGVPSAHDGLNDGAPALFTNPVSCGAGGEAVLSMTSSALPGELVQVPAAFPAMSGCGALTFETGLSAAPETSVRDTPAGFVVGLWVAQEANGPASADLRDAVVRFPQGVSISPGAAHGLGACQDAGAEGFGFGEEGVVLGTAHLLPGRCPASSVLGTVKIVTPLLSVPLTGHLFLGAPRCGGSGQAECSEADAMDGGLYRVFLEAEALGQVIKLEGHVSANPVTGQLAVTFDEAPEFPFSELTVSVNGGQDASLATPQTCGSFQATSDLTPWSAPETPDAFPASEAFTVAGCPGVIPFAPAVSAGSVSEDADASSPFTFTLTRQDGEQDLSGLRVTTPAGLTALLSGVALCEEPAAAAGTCPEASRVGSVTAAAGAGSDPYWLSGQVYLTGPYAGAPFGLSAVVPVKAGPFNLGVQVVRAAINVNPTTTAVTVTSAAVPQIKDGVPIRLRTLNVTLDRPGFMENPTSCAAQSIASSAAGNTGAVSNVASPFAVSGCNALTFKPVFTASTAGVTSKKNGASLDVKLAMPAGPGANIRSVRVDLPLAMPSRTTTLQQACPAAVFEANPANCPGPSVVGVAKAATPVLPVELTGPVYLVSHASEAFPNVVVVLQGDGVRIDLTGDTDIVKGVTSSTFKTIPDQPVSSFELYLPQGKFSQFAANGNFCKEKLVMPTVITAQNGIPVKQSTTITVTGCPKPKPAKKPKAKKASRVARGAGSQASGQGKRR